MKSGLDKWRDDIDNTLLCMQLEQMAKTRNWPRIYIAGKMRGHPSFQFEEFFVQARRLKELGWQVINPAEEDAKRLAQGITLTYREVLAEDIKLVSTCDAIYMLKGWEDSGGATAEHAFAVACELEVIKQGEEVV
jgi:hypothetical protein